MGLARLLLDTPLRRMPWKAFDFLRWRGNLLLSCARPAQVPANRPDMCNRLPIFERLFALAKESRPQGPYVIVEVGRFRGEFWTGEGSTFFFSKWLAENGGGTLHSVDLSTETMVKAKVACEPYRGHIEWHNVRSSEFLAAYAGPIDILYLDGVGWNEDAVGKTPQFHSQYEHWADFVLARGKVRGAIGVDDTDGIRWGKGALIAAYLEGKGLPWETIYCAEAGSWPCGIVARWNGVSDGGG